MIKTNKRNGELQAKYETYLPTEKATTVMCSQLSAKLLLEYNHLGANTTIVFCVPRKKIKKLVGIIQSLEWAFQENLIHT